MRITLTARGRALRRRAAAVPGQAAGATGCGLAELDGLAAQLHRLRDSIITHAVR